MIDNLQFIKWHPTANIKTLKQRALILQQIRIFFNQRDYLEVETPLLGHHGVTDPYLSNINAYFLNTKLHLQTSPEYHMKRLLAMGSGAIYQITKAFRNDEIGRLHNPEFTMLEWYQLDVNHHFLMDEINDFLKIILQTKDLIKIPYKDVFLEFCDVDPFANNKKNLLAKLQNILKDFALDNVLPQDEKDLDQYLFLIMSHIIEPELAKNQNPIAIYNFPVSQAALAKINNGIAERFEIYYKGIELANGFHELLDYNEQLKRFNNDNAVRKQKMLPLVEPDENFLQALKHGLPHCSGVALGIDRLIMLALNHSSIDKVMSFSYENS